MASFALASVRLESLTSVGRAYVLSTAYCLLPTAH